MCVSLFPVCAVPSSYTSPFCSCPQSLPPGYQLSLSLLPWQQLSVPAVVALSLHLLPLQLRLQLRSSLIFCHYFISFIYQAMCACSKTSTVNILILWHYFNQSESRPVFFLLPTYSELLSSMLGSLKEERIIIIILNIVLPLIHGRSSTNWIETANILKCKLD